MVECSLWPSFEMASPVLFVLILGLGFQVVFARDHYSEGFMDKLSSGMKFATNILGKVPVSSQFNRF